MPNHIIIASHNPVKVRATVKAFARMFPNQMFTNASVSVPSGVPDQPMSSVETLRGALNRAQRATLQKGATHQSAFGVGIEGGIEDSDDGMMAFAWVAITDGQAVGKSRTALFFLPEEVARLVREGQELGDADDAVFGRANSKQQNGAVGLLTGDVVNRASLYEQAIIMALIPFKNRHFSWGR